MLRWFSWWQTTIASDGADDGIDYVLWWFADQVTVLTLSSKTVGGRYWWWWWWWGWWGWWGWWWWKEWKMEWTYGQRLLYLYHKRSHLLRCDADLTSFLLFLRRYVVITACGPHLLFPPPLFPSHMKTLKKMFEEMGQIKGSCLPNCLSLCLFIHSSNPVVLFIVIVTAIWMVKYTITTIEMVKSMYHYKRDG